MTDLNIKKYEKQTEAIVAQAKDALKQKDKKKATLLMKKKKMIEKEISKLEGMQMMLEQQKLQLESTMNNKHVFDTMSEATKQAEWLQKESNIDQFEDIREKFEEQQDKQNEVYDFFNQFAEENGEDV